jgi:molybdenum cofactor cytidylyltransferase
MNKVGAIILAAGKSSRMGRNKMLEPVNGKAMLLHVVDAVIDARLEGPIIALGNEAERVSRSLINHHHIPIIVTDFYEGLSHSLRAAIAAVPDDWDASFVCLGDMPFVTSGLLKDMAQQARVDQILVPFHGGKRGNPILWGRNFFTEMMESEGDTGARALIKSHSASVTPFPAPDDSIHRDIDYLADLRV